MSSRISLFKKGLAEVLDITSVSKFKKVIFPAALGISTYKEALENLASVIENQNARSKDLTFEIWSPPYLSLSDPFKSVWSIPPKPSGRRTPHVCSPPIVASKIALNSACYQFAVSNASENILSVFDADNWTWRYYSARSLTFGNVHSAFSFVRITTQLSRYLYKRYRIVMIPYIDDFIILSIASLAELEFNTVKSFLAQLGLAISTKADGCKIGCINKPIDLLRINYTFMPSAFRITIPPEKLHAAHEKADAIANALKDGKNPSIKDLLSLYWCVSFIIYFRRFKKELMCLTLLNKLLAAEEYPVLSDAYKNSLLILIASLKHLIDNRQCLEI